MKKLLIALALVGASTGAFAQDNEPTQQYSVATNSFWSNWFVQAGANWNAWYTNSEHGLGLDKSPLKSFRSNPGASVAIGKWFTPGLGLRTKLYGIWGKAPHAYVRNAKKDNSFKYWSLNEQVMFNLSNMLCGYSETRVWNVIPFVGGGLARNMKANTYAMDLNVGLQSTWRLSKHFNVYLEGGWLRYEDDFDGYTENVIGGSQERGWDDKDNQFYAEVGLTYKLGKATWSKVPDVDALKAQYQSAIDAVNAKLSDANAENDRLKKMLANQKPSQTVSKSVKELVTTPVSVFFNISKTDIASQKDLVNVRALAKYAKDNNSNLLVTGYADSATGTPEGNKKLSEGRANAVKAELVKMGVSESKIKTDAKGGVETLSPISFNRRATVQVTD